MIEKVRIYADFGMLSKADLLEINPIMKMAITSNKYRNAIVPPLETSFPYVGIIYVFIAGISIKKATNIDISITGIDTFLF